MPTRQLKQRAREYVWFAALLILVLAGSALHPAEPARASDDSGVTASASR